MGDYPQPIIRDYWDQTLYPDIPDDQPHRWAWEFIRRNAEYQRLYDECHECRSDSAKFEKLMGRMQELFDNWSMDWRDDKVVRMAGSSQNFHTDLPAWIPLDEEVVISVDILREELNYSHPVVLAFDAAQPIDVQVARLRRVLQRHRRHVQRSIPPKSPRLQKLLPLLQVLDGLAVGDSAAAVQVRLDREGDDNWGRTLKRAREMRDEDGLTLAKYRKD